MEIDLGTNQFTKALATIYLVRDWLVKIYAV